MIGFLPSTRAEQVPAAGALRQRGQRHEDGVLDELEDAGTTGPLPKAISRSMGSVKIRLARSHTPPRSKMSVQLSESMKCFNPATMSPPISPRVAIFCSTHAAALLMMP